MNTFEPKGFRSVASTAEFFEVSPDTVMRWVARGHLASINVGTARRPKTRIPIASIERFVEKRARHVELHAVEAQPAALSGGSS